MNLKHGKEARHRWVPSFFLLVVPGRIELPTYRLGVGRSNISG